MAPIKPRKSLLKNTISLAIHSIPSILLQKPKIIALSHSPVFSIYPACVFAWLPNESN